MRKQFDVLGLGCTAVDEILYVRSYPPADTSMEVRERERHCGGLCATALIAAARLGARCAYAGTLGHGEAARFVLQTFRREAVNVRHVARRAARAPLHSVIIVDEVRQTRNIFYHPPHASGADPRKPARNVILAARVLLVDRFGLPGMIRAARLARSAGIPVVGDFDTSPLPRLGELMRLVDHLIVSRKFACALTGARSAAAAAAALWGSGRQAVIVTCGEEGGWIRDASSRGARHFPAFQVRPIDTIGCGDVFHGAYAAALAWGWEVLDRVRFASAAAALKSLHRGGQEGIPNRRSVDRFLQQSPGWRDKG